MLDALVFELDEAAVTEWLVLMPAEGIAMNVISERLAARAPLVQLANENDAEAALARIADDVNVLVATSHVPPLDAAYLSRFPKLQLISNFGVGYDHIDAAWAGAHGVVVTHTPGVLDAEVADTALALTLMTVRRLPQAERYLREGRWTSAPFPLSPSLRGRTMGILGLGRIGREIARRAAAFGLDIVYHGRQAQPDAPYPFFSSLKAMAEACDILIVAAPGGPQTQRIVNREILEALGPNGVLINVARGSLVDEPALIEALARGTILAAGLDVFDNEPDIAPQFLAFDNAVLLPHVGSASERTRLGMANLVVDNVFSWIDGKGPITPTAETPWPRP
jgi:lactate dehydrogenase-like 2-hydroxyacid dehydrogenase